jgi:hypothetical protein
MINKFNISKALRDNAKTIADANSVKLVSNGELYDPDINLGYVEEIALYGKDTSIGLADESSDIQFGIYQININTPKTKTKWSGLKLADIFNAGFSKGLELTYNGQMVRIKNTTFEPMMQNDTHLIHILSINFSVIN